MASAFLPAVRVGGKEVGLSFSWAFALKEQVEA